MSNGFSFKNKFKRLGKILCGYQLLSAPSTLFGINLLALQPISEVGVDERLQLLII